MQEQATGEKRTLRLEDIHRRAWLRLRVASCALALLAAVSCSRAPAPAPRAVRFRGNNADVYLQSISDTLNNLPSALDLELLPAQPVLTASTSADGKEVRAICIRNPQLPEGPINYLQAVDGNANFASMKVKAGDIVRYYVNLDADAAERDIEQRTALELTVRRLDATDPENVLIIDGPGLNAPALYPQRIEVWRFSDKRTEAIREILVNYETLRRPPVAWEPSPDMGALRQIAERASQWLRNLPEIDVDWRREPLLDGLPAELKNAKGVAEAIAEENLANGTFSDGDAREMEQAIWCRDISQWVRRDATTDLDAAVALFDWTVRNVQLDRPEQADTVLFPWQALVYGHGTTAHRAWVFVELCRQQQIEAAVLQPAAKGDQPAPLLVGVLLSEGKEIYLFDPTLGLPLPGPDGTVGTLAELLENAESLRTLDVEGQEYPLDGDQLKQVEARLVASPLQLARRIKLLEDSLEGENFVRLSAEISKRAAHVRRHPHLAGFALWEQPFQAIADAYSIRPSRRKLAKEEFQPFADRPLLWKARVMHFQGNKDKRFEERNDPLADVRAGHQDALKLYQDPTVRIADDVLAKLEEAKQISYNASKSAASYWMGLLSYERGNYAVATTWLGKRSLEREPNGKWAHGARYNLARTYEAMGQLDQAIKLLESDPEDAPQRHGNLVRAKRLKAQAEAAQPANR
jgi:TolA-binding protein